MGAAGATSGTVKGSWTGSIDGVGLGGTTGTLNTAGDSCCGKTAPL